jgi:hypothetical protein
MAIRTDVTVDWVSSPRLITVAAPSVEISIQDIVDTCRAFEDTTPNEIYEFLIDAAGKEALGGTTSVGITATLNNAQIAFEARPGPNWILCTISGGNLVAEDDVGDPIDPRYPTAYTTIDRAASSSATLSDVSSPEDVADAVWDEPLADHTTTGTYGEELATKADIVTAEDIADAVWDESLADHTTTGTYGAAIAQTLGLMHSNIYIDDATYDEHGNMISARVRTYSDAASVGTNNNIIETYRITSDGTECGQFDFWKQVVGP